MGTHPPGVVSAARAAAAAATRSQVLRDRVKVHSEIVSDALSVG